MTTTILTWARATVTACVAIALTTAAAGCSSHTGESSGVDAAHATAPGAAAQAAGTAVLTEVNGELSVGETPWWQLATTPPPPSNPPTGGDPPPPRRFILSGGVLFEPNSPTLTPGAGTQLGVILSQVQGLPDVRITVDGYTNADGGPERAAVTLAAARAGTVKSWFVVNGISATRITTHGWGDRHPIYPHPINDSERAANRRCEISVAGGAP